MFTGPQPQDRAARLRMVDKIVQDLHATHGDRIIAIGLYGSLAKGIDGPFSDIELFCVVQGSNIDYSHEWVYGVNKAEVDMYSEEMIRRSAVTVDEKWSLSQGQLLAAQPLYGDPAFFAELRQLVLSTPAEDFKAVMRAMLVGEFYEWIGKLRNARSSGHTAYIPLLACHFVEFGAQLLGMAQRFCYTTGAKMIEESLQLNQRPDGYDELCQMVMAGQLSDPAQVTAALERCWLASALGQSPKGSTWMNIIGGRFEQERARSMLVVMAGLPGTGKSAIARALAAALPAVILDKDPIRAALFPSALLEYSTQQDDFCMQVMLQVAEYILRKQPTDTVVLDGRTFSRRYQLEAVAELATNLGQQVAIIECVCSDATAKQRLEQDVAQNLHVASNRNFALYLAIKARFEPIERPKLVINTDQDLSKSITISMAYLKQTLNRS